MTFADLQRMGRNMQPFTGRVLFRTSIKHRTAAVGGCLLVAALFVVGGCLRTSSRHDHQPTPSADPLIAAARSSMVSYANGLSEISSQVAKDLRNGTLADNAAVFDYFAKESEICRKRAMREFETALQNAVPANGQWEPERLAAGFESLAAGFAIDGKPLSRPGDSTVTTD